MVGLGSGPVGAPEPSPTTVTIFLRLRRGYELGAFRRRLDTTVRTERGMRWRRAKREIAFGDPDPDGSLAQSFVEVLEQGKIGDPDPVRSGAKTIAFGVLLLI